MAAVKPLDISARASRELEAKERRQQGQEEKNPRGGIRFPRRRSRCLSQEAAQP
jgi:hypothetical protein